MQYSVRAIKAGESQVPRPEVFWMEGFGERETLFFMIFLIQGNGLNVLVNTGPPQDLDVINAAWLKFCGFEEAQIKRREEERPQTALRSLGVDRKDIHKVILTPLQAYATSNITLFPNADIYISRKGWIEDFQAPYYHLHVPRHLRIPPDQNNYLQNEGWGKLHLLEDEDEVAPGITTFWAGVHHRSSLAVCIQTKKGKVIISDCFFKYPNVEQHKYLGVQESMIEADATYQRLRKEGDILVPIYDPEVFERFPGGIIA